MDNLEKDLLNLKNEKIEVPKSVLDKINVALDEIRDKNNKVEQDRQINNIEFIEKERRDLFNEDNINKKDIKECRVADGNRMYSKDKEKKNSFNKRKYASIAAGISLVALLGLSSPVRATINKIFFNNPGIESAINNNYIQEISNKEIVTDDFNMKLNNVLVDSSHIILEFELDIRNAKTLFKLDSEKDNVYSDIALYTGDGEVICEDGYVGMIGSNVYTFDDSKISEGKLYLRTLFESTEGKIPKMDHIKIKFKSLKFRNSTTDKLIYSSELNWDLNVNLDNKFTQVNEIQYSFENESPNIVIHDAKAIPTGLFLNFDYLVPGHDENILLAMRVIDENGKEYRMNGANMESLENGGDRLSGTFDGISSFDNVEKFTLEIKNPDGKTIDKVSFFKEK
ncbi:DUF4179 domain-containing protein [Clostridium perfringens]|nr:DUF4179 domain-containing protein [Clostridium perfringens]